MQGWSEYEVAFEKKIQKWKMFRWKPKSVSDQSQKLAQVNQKGFTKNKKVALEKEI